MGFYKSLIVCMDFKGSYWVLIGPYRSLIIVMGSNGPYVAL